MLWENGLYCEIDAYQNIQVLAINDEPTSSSHAYCRNDLRGKASTSTLSRSSLHNKSVQPTVITVQSFNDDEENSPVILKTIRQKFEVGDNNDFVEVTNLDEPPICGVKVAIEDNPVFPCNNSRTKSLRSHYSPTVSHKPMDLANSKMPPRQPRSTSIDQSSYLSRNNARKSRFTDAFLDAKERLDQELEENDANNRCSGISNFRHSKIILSPDTINTPIGVEVTAVPDPDNPNKILAVEIISIEENGRIAQNGGLKVGDQITEINGQLCSEMSLARARLDLRSLENILDPSLSFNRQIQSHNHSEQQKVVIKPAKSALQMANSSREGEDLSFVIIKVLGNSGLGFSFAGRKSRNAINLFYVTVVKNDGPSFGKLKIGDRLLKIDKADLLHLQQSDVTSILKSKKVGESANILISRISSNSPNLSKTDGEMGSSNTKTVEIEALNVNNIIEDSFFSSTELVEMATEMAKDRRELVQLDIAFNGSPRAGLGVSLMAQKIYNDGMAFDSGLYIGSVLNGGAAFKDGRLQENDRLVAIERENLLRRSLNADALDTFRNIFSQVPLTTNSVRIIVARKVKDSQSALQEKSIEKSSVSVTKENCALENMNEDVVQVGTEESESDVDHKDAFIRDTVIRKSISEKRPLGAHRDPSHLQTYQRIKHFRQTSAPALAVDGLLRSFSSSSTAYPSAEGRLYTRRQSLGSNTGRYTRNTFDNSNNKDDKGRKGSSLKKRARPATVYCIDDDNHEISVDGNTSGNPYEEIFSPDIMPNKFATLPTNSRLLKSGGSSATDSSNNWKMSTKFFDFFKATNQKKALVDWSAENSKENASPGRRSMSIDPLRRRSLETRGCKKRLTFTLDDINSMGETHNLQHTTSDRVTSHIPNSISQPSFELASKTRIPLSNLVDDGADAIALSKEKSQRRKSTGSGLLKLFQKASPTFVHYLPAEDEKEALKYNELSDEKARLRAIDEAFRVKYGLANHSPNALRRAQLPSYNQYLQNSNTKQNESIDSSFSPINHQRGHSVHELPLNDRIKENCCQEPSSGTITTTAAIATAAINNNVDNLFINPFSSPSSILGTIKTWNKTHSPTTDNEISMESSLEYANLAHPNTTLSNLRNVTAPSIATKRIVIPVNENANSTVYPQNIQDSNNNRFISSTTSCYIPTIYHHHQLMSCSPHYRRPISPDLENQQYVNKCQEKTGLSSRQNIHHKYQCEHPSVQNSNTDILQYLWPRSSTHSIPNQTQEEQEQLTTITTPSTHGLNIVEPVQNTAPTTWLITGIKPSYHNLRTNHPAPYQHPRVKQTKTDAIQGHQYSNISCTVTSNPHSMPRPSPLCQTIEMSKPMMEISDPSPTEKFYSNLNNNISRAQEVICMYQDDYQLLKPMTSAYLRKKVNVQRRNSLYLTTNWNSKRETQSLPIFTPHHHTTPPNRSHCLTNFNSTKNSSISSRLENEYNNNTTNANENFVSSEIIRFGNVSPRMTASNERFPNFSQSHSLNYKTRLNLPEYYELFKNHGGHQFSTLQNLKRIEGKTKSSWNKNLLRESSKGSKMRREVASAVFYDELC